MATLRIESRLARDDREFFLILAACGLGYALLVAALSFVPTPKPAGTDVARLPPRIARLILEAPPVPRPTVTPRPPAIVETPPPKAPAPERAQSSEQRPARPKSDAPPTPAPPPERTAEEDAAAAEAARLRLEAEAAAAHERNRAVAKQSGLLKALGAETGGTALNDEHPGLDRVLGDVSVLSNPSLPAAGGGGGVPGLGDGAGTGAGNGRLSVEDLVAGLKGDGTGGVVILASKGTAGVESSLIVKNRGPLRGVEAIRRVVKALDPWLKFQYNKAQREQPSLTGSLTVEFTITATGDVSDCQTPSSSLAYPPLEDLILKRFCLLKFPPLPEESDDEVRASYQIDFEGLS